MLPPFPKVNVKKKKKKERKERRKRGEALSRFADNSALEGAVIV
jgi:hypothetical protein